MAPQATTRWPAFGADRHYDNIDVLVGKPDTEGGTPDVDDAQLADALAGDFRLQSPSPVRNTCNAPLPWTGIDLGSDPRIVESAPDLGAYEVQDVLIADGFEE